MSKINLKKLKILFWYFSKWKAFWIVILPYSQTSINNLFVFAFQKYFFLKLKVLCFLRFKLFFFTFRYVRVVLMLFFGLKKHHWTDWWMYNWFEQSSYTFKIHSCGLSMCATMTRSKTNMSIVVIILGGENHCRLWWIHKKKIEFTQKIEFLWLRLWAWSMVKK
jgi:hypothetical protein